MSRINDIKVLARTIRDEQNIPYTEALNIAAVQKGFRDYNTACILRKSGSVHRDVPHGVCCRCGELKPETSLSDSKLSTEHKKFKLCTSCVKKEQKFLRRYHYDMSIAIKELVPWYESPKLRLGGNMVKALCVEKGISVTQARSIVALILGYPDYSTFVVVAEKYRQEYRGIEPRVSRSAVLRRERVANQSISTKRREIRNLSKKIREARIRTAGEIFDPSSGTLHSRVGLLPTHCSPIDKVATRVVFRPHEQFSDRSKSKCL